MNCKYFKFKLHSIPAHQILYYIPTYNSWNIQPKFDFYLSKYLEKNVALEYEIKTVVMA